MASPAGARPDEGDWTVQAADTIERVVGTIRDNTAVRLTTVARGLVYGVLVAVMGVAIVVWLIVMAIRLVNILLPGDVWATYLFLGGIFVLVGAFFLRKASSAAASKG
ncbi:MAG TPA: hypothetical protein VFJ85_08350 [Acidimicrobiales bacterium]|nr:hypothetical protein [Acidimicrobiales bacterium]